MFVYTLGIFVPCHIRILTICLNLAMLVITFITDAITVSFPFSVAPVVRLAGGSDRSHGRVEIVIDGAIYTVCDDNWNNRDADVVCRSFGYRRGQALKVQLHSSWILRSCEVHKVTSARIQVRGVCSQMCVL